MIMLRERRTSGTPRTSDGDCDCGILSDVLDGLNKVVADDAVVAAGEQADANDMLTEEKFFPFEI